MLVTQCRDSFLNIANELTFLINNANEETWDAMFNEFLERNDLKTELGHVQFDPNARGNDGRNRE